jgi:formate/nitrite transporter FocA (FNT family)
VASTAFTGTGAAVLAKKIAVKKVSSSLGAAFVKGVGANWLVNIAVFQAACAATPAGKIAALWMPVTAFVALGLEHSVANMFLLPLGAWYVTVCTSGGVVRSIVAIATSVLTGSIISYSRATATNEIC